MNWWRRQHRGGDRAQLEVIKTADWVIDLGPKARRRRRNRRLGSAGRHRQSAAELYGKVLAPCWRKREAAEERASEAAE